MDRHDPHIEALPLLDLAVVDVQPGFQHLPGGQVVVLRLGLDAVVEEGQLADHKAIFDIILILSTSPDLSVKDLLFIFQYLDHTLPILDIFIFRISGRQQELKRTRIIQRKFQLRLYDHSFLIPWIIQRFPVHICLIHYKLPPLYLTLTRPVP